MKVLITLIFIIMTTATVATKTTTYELVVYKIKNEYVESYHEVLEAARERIRQFPGMLEYQTFRSAECDRVFMDLVKWRSLEEALDASHKVEKMRALAPFMAAFEEVKFMDHFELFNQGSTKKVDLAQLDKKYYLAKSEPHVVDVTPYNYLAINGMSAPEDPRFTKAVEALYAVAYGVKFQYKAMGQDFVVPKMEGQWWVEGELPFDQTPREEWYWNIAIPMPAFVEAEHVEEAIQAAIDKKGLPPISEVEFKKLNEGKSVQVLHIGSYEAERPTLEKLFSFVESNGLQINGYHHEIYLSDPHKTPVEKLKTIIRYPVK